MTSMLTFFTMLRVLTLIALFVSTAAEILTDPQSVTVYEGQTITLICKSDIFDNGQLCPTYTFYWRIDTTWTDPYLTNCDYVYDFKDRMTVSKINGEYSLTIGLVRFDDSGRYYCYVSGFESERADLVVLREPPSCDVTPSDPTVGTTAQLKCQLSSGDPPSLLTWIEVASGTVVDSGSTEPIDPGDYFTADIQVTELDNFKEFACVAGPDRTNGARCVITPLQVETNVLISPSPSVTVYEGQMATFTCTSESIPSADEFRWRVSKPNGVEDKVNMNTISNLRGDYTLSDKGQDLRIVRVSIVEFDNATIRCISFTPGNTRESVSSQETMLLVLPASEGRTTHQPLETYPLRPDSSDDPDSNSSTGIVVGGVIGVALLLTIIASLAFYLLRNKNGNLKQRLSRNRFHNLSANARPTMSVVQASPTYEEVPQDAVRYQTRSSSDDVTEQPALYALPEAAVKHGPETSGNPSPAYANSSVYVNLPRHGEQRPLSGATGDNKRIVISGEVKYSVLDKSRQTAHSPSPAGETTEGALQSTEDPKQKNAEGLVYAELDLENPRPASSLENSQHADESINYASIRGDMAAVRSLLSRD